MMISGNRRIPLVYSNQKAKDPIYFKYVPDKLRVIKFGCLCPPPSPPPVCTPPTSVTLAISGNDLIITFPNGILIQVYNGYLVRVVDNFTIATVVANVNVGGTYTVPNGATGLTSGLQYVIRLESDGLSGPPCEFTTYSNTITAP